MMREYEEDLQVFGVFVLLVVLCICSNNITFK